MENKLGCNLQNWIEQAASFRISEWRSFAKKQLSDFEAVRNVLTMPWNIGQVEGKINKLKTIKR